MYSEQKQALAAELSFKHPAVLAVSGSAGSGKTALLAALLPVLKSRGLKVGVIREADDLRLPADATDEQLAAWNALQTIFTTSEGRLQTDEEQHLRQGQGDHREVDALTPNGKPAEDQSQQGTTEGTQQQADFRGQTPDFHRVTSHVRGATEEGRVAEREKPGVAQQQVECTGKQGEAHELHDEHGIRTNKRCCNQAQQQQAVSHIGDSF